MAAIVTARPMPDALLASLDLADCRRHSRQAELNSAHQKMLDLARALATARGCCWWTNSRPASTPRNSTARRGKAQGAGALRHRRCIVVEHLMGFIDQITDRSSS